MIEKEIKQFITNPNNTSFHLLLYGSQKTDDQKKKIIEECKNSLTYHDNNNNNDFCLYIHYNSFVYKNIKQFKIKINEFVKCKQENKKKILVIYNIDNINLDFQYFLKNIMDNHHLYTIMTCYRMDNFLDGFSSRFFIYRLNYDSIKNHTIIEIKILEEIYQKVLVCLLEKNDFKEINTFNHQYLSILKYLSNNKYSDIAFYMLFFYITHELKDKIPDKIISEIQKYQQEL